MLLEIKRILEEKINIYEKTIIKSLEQKDNFYIAHTEKYQIKAKKIVLACHYPFFINPYFFPFKTSLEKGYLCAAEVEKLYNIFR